MPRPPHSTIATSQLVHEFSVRSNSGKWLACAVTALAPGPNGEARYCIAVEGHGAYLGDIARLSTVTMIGRGGFDLLTATRVLDALQGIIGAGNTLKLAGALEMAP